MNKRSPVGKTKSQGWEVGIRRTFSVSAGRAWELLMTPPGLGYWLGNAPNFKPEPGAAFTTTEGTTGFVVSIQEGASARAGGALLRLRWQPPDWPGPSTLQLRVIPTGSKATIAFHQERLAGPAQRAQLRKHWAQVLRKLEELAKQDSSPSDGSADPK